MTLLTCEMFLALFYRYKCYLCICACVYSCCDPVIFVKCPHVTLDCIKIIEL